MANAADLNFCKGFIVGYFVAFLVFIKLQITDKSISTHAHTDSYFTNVLTLLTVGSLHLKIKTGYTNLVPGGTTAGEIHTSINV